MLTMVFEKQKEKKNLILFASIFIFIYGLYFFLDWLAHGSFSALFEAMSPGLFTLHQVFNIVMAFMATLMISLSQIKLTLTSTEPLGATGIPFFSFIFGLLTFGCAPCVVAFLSAVGIAFTPIVFPMGNLLWKVILLTLMILGFIYILKSINKGVCKPKKIKD